MAGETKEPVVDEQIKENNTGEKHDGTDAKKEEKKSETAPELKLGDLVWAKMSSFQAWPGKIVKPWPNVKKPAGKKPMMFVYFFGTEDHAWVKVESLKLYIENRDAMMKTAKGVKVMKAIEAVDKAIKEEKNKKTTVSPYHPDDEDEISPKKPTKDYTREPLTGKSKISGNSDDEGNIFTNLTKNPKFNSSKTENKKKTKSKEETDEDDKPLKDSSGKKKTKAQKSLSETLKISYASPKRKNTSSLGSTPVKRPKSDAVTFSSLSLYNSFQAHLADKGGTPSKSSIKPIDKKIGFIGLGLMGTGMAMNLLRTGHDVTVWNRTDEKCQDIVKAGALKAESVADLVRSCDITFSMVSDSEALRAIVYGENGAAAGMSEGKAFVDMSTVDIGTITGVEAAISTRGGKFLEAPVAGSVQPAMEGSLIILAAGSQEVYDECQTCFQAMGKKAFYLGDVGNGARMKLVLNLIGGGVMCSLAEGLLLAEKAGLTQSILMDVLQLGSLASPMVCGKGRAILAGKFPPAFPLKYQQKDMRLALAMADQVDQPLPVSASVHEVFKRAKVHGFGDSDMSAVYKSLMK